MTRTSATGRALTPQLLMFASGFAGLGYQIIWTQQCSVWLGHESAAVLAVVAAFFGGLGIGGLVLGGVVERSSSVLRWYVGCELLVATWGLVLLAAASTASAWLLHVTGANPAFLWQWLVAFLGTFVLLLPATGAMGATLPAMERLTSGIEHRGRSISALYASNTLGAVAGVIATAFWLIPNYGLRVSSGLCVALNVLTAVTALVAFPRESPVTGAPEKNAVAPQLRLAVTGFLGIGFEVVVVRVLSQLTEDTVYTFALVLAVYLVGTAAGAAAYRYWLEKRSALEGTTDRLLLVVAAACLLGAGSLWGADGIKTWALSRFGSGVLGALTTEAALSACAFLLPTCAMGALFSHLSRDAKRAQVSFGRALGVNTLAAAAAPAVFGLWFIPTFGTKVALILVSCGYVALTTRNIWTQPWALIPSALIAGMAALAPPLRFVDVPDGGRVVRYEEGLMAAVSIVEDAEGVGRLRINNRQQEGSNAAMRVDARQAWLPLLLHESPKRVLFLGLGTGVTASSAARDPALSVDAVELLPEVAALSPYFTANIEGASRLHVRVADARRYVRATDRTYDVIVSDNFHPARSGSGALYTVEHFEAVRRRLEHDGLFCQWLPLHQLDLDTLRSIVRSFLVAFPQASAILANYSLETPVIGLLGRADSKRFDRVALGSRIDHSPMHDWTTRLGLEDEYAVFGSFIAGPTSLSNFAGSARLNTDDHPVVTYTAPRITYVAETTPSERLSTLLASLAVVPNELFVPATNDANEQRLIAYWSARNRFIETGRHVRPSSRAEDMIAQVGGPLLAVLKLSPDFRPAYDPLLSMARAILQTDPPAGRALLTELTRVQPDRSEAQQALAQLITDLSSSPQPSN